MKRRHILLWTLLMVSLGLVCAQVVFAADDPLPSWQDGAPKRAIVDFVTRVTREAGADFYALLSALPRSTTMAHCGSSSPCMWAWKGVLLRAERSNSASRYTACE
jgi:hypothetical protein